MLPTYQSILSSHGYIVHPDGPDGFAVESPKGALVPCKMRQKFPDEQYRLNGIKIGYDEGRYLLAIGSEYYWTPCVSTIDATLQPDETWEIWVRHDALVPIGSPIYPTPDCI